MMKINGIIIDGVVYSLTQSSTCDNCDLKELCDSATTYLGDVCTSLESLADIRMSVFHKSQELTDKISKI